jgi:hypothetical protein
MIILHLPESLQRFSEHPCLELDISRLSDLPLAIQAQNPALARILFEGPTQLSGFINLYVNRKLITTLDDSTILPPGEHRAELCVALSGG